MQRRASLDLARFEQFDKRTRCNTPSVSLVLATSAGRVAATSRIHSFPKRCELHWSTPNHSIVFTAKLRQLSCHEFHHSRLASPDGPTAIHWASIHHSAAQQVFCRVDRVHRSVDVDSFAQVEANRSQVLGRPRKSLLFLFDLILFGDLFDQGSSTCIN